MLLLDGHLIDEDVLTTSFCCNLGACKGACCVQGESGAPLDPAETTLLEDLLPALQPWLRPEGLAVLAEQGAWVRDHEGDLTTPLVKGEECAYAIFENGVALCGIEKAWKAGAVPFQKPVSCHLYPIRVEAAQPFPKLNYHHWRICTPALMGGEAKGVPLVQFVKDGLVRKFGTEFYEQLAALAAYQSSAGE